MIARMRTCFSLSVLAAIFCITDQCRCYCSRRRHHRWHPRRGSPSPVLKLPSTVSNFDLFTNDDHQLPSAATTATTRAKYSTIQLLSSEEHQHIHRLVQKRSISRWNGEYNTADEIRSSIEEIRIFIPWNRILQTFEDQTLLHGYNIKSNQVDDIEIEYKVMVTDIPRTDGGGSYWELVPIQNYQLVDIIDPNKNKDNVLQLAHAALGMAVSSSERGVDVDKAALHNLVRRAIDRLQTLKQLRTLSALLPGASAALTAKELHGRKAADAVLWFALAGYYTGCSQEDNSGDMELYSDLVDIATEELQRFGMNSSCRAKDVLHIVERVAMAGIVGTSSKRLFRVAADCLTVKMMHGSIKDYGIHDQASENANMDVDTLVNADEKDESIDYKSIIQSLKDFSFGLHSDRSLLGLWRFSTRQRKQRTFFKNAARHFDGKYEFPIADTTVNSVEQYDWWTMFKDPSRPLVVDVGCGMGVSLLGLASALHFDDQDKMDIDWSECNFVGVDLSSLAIGYANGVCSRWGLENVLTFIVDSAENCLAKLYETYPGTVSLIMLQFPTPYRFPNIANIDSEGVNCVGFNTQLPEGSKSVDFMVTEKLLAKIHDILSKHKGRLLIQSNCEDVAVHMQNASTKKGFHSITFTHYVKSLACVTQRAHRWTEIGGERAIGGVWSSQPLLPVVGRTETEVACIIDGKPVHRCLLGAATKSCLVDQKSLGNSMSSTTEWIITPWAQATRCPVPPNGS